MHKCCHKRHIGQVIYIGDSEPNKMLFVKENYKECNPVEVEEEKKTKGRMVTKLSKSRDKTA